MNEFVVEFILDHKIIDNNIIYLIKWKDSNENTWEPEKNLFGLNLLSKYKKLNGLYKKKINKIENFKQISNIIGIKKNSIPPDIIYIVRFYDDIKYSEISSKLIQENQPQILINFLESNLPF